MQDSDTVIMVGNGPSAADFLRCRRQFRTDTCAVSGAITLFKRTAPTHWAYVEHDDCYPPEAFSRWQTQRHTIESNKASTAYKWPIEVQSPDWPKGAMDPKQPIKRYYNNYSSLLYAVQIMARVGYKRILFVGCEGMPVNGIWRVGQPEPEGDAKDVQRKKLANAAHAVGTLVGQGVEMIDCSNGILSQYMPSDTWAERWVIIGAGVDASLYAPLAVKYADVLATTNSGIDIEPRPDIYWLTDQVAVEKYFDKAKASGAKIITSNLAVDDFYNPWLASEADEIVHYERRYCTVFRPGELVNCRTSGGMLVQYAVNQGAKEVHLVGFTGYQSTPDHVTQDYDDGRMGHPRLAAAQAIYGPCLQSVFDKSQQTQFIFHGAPNYPWKGPNVTISEELAATA